MSKSTNKFGVPYHSYSLLLAGKGWEMFDMAWPESWGDVDTAWMTRAGVVKDKPFAGYGNDEDGYYRILKVRDDDEGKFIPVEEFMKRCESYVANYSE